jgi:hypothetical protein
MSVRVADGLQSARPSFRPGAALALARLTAISFSVAMGLPTRRPFLRMLNCHCCELVRVDRLFVFGLPQPSFVLLRTPLAAEQLRYLEWQVGRIAAEWREDASAAVEIEARLRQHGFDDTVVNAGAISPGTRSFCHVR